MLEKLKVGKVAGELETVINITTLDYKCEKTFSEQHSCNTYQFPTLKVIK